jgi:hypothetical protein
LATAGAFSLLVHIASRLASGGIIDDPGAALYAAAAAFVGSLASALATEVHWRRTHRLEQQLFDVHRPSLARHLGRKPEALHFYSSEQVGHAAPRAGPADAPPSRRLG